MKNEEKTCPICGNKYYGYPAISRIDNETEICPNCGTKQGIEAMQNYYSKKPEKKVK
ncbi:hypothetical protein [Clostridium sp.]|uniref:hypothetical protein n=1 Tax=Clostridium sp. TaxID=1506 RepID=UPI001A5F1539|nr:hypothetical protein [Clostridium sp.]MBK5234071.1 hypothetical protein [Clostridium sp.]